jgi:hypothetical protein
MTDKVIHFNARPRHICSPAEYVLSGWLTRALTYRIARHIPRRYERMRGGGREKGETGVYPRRGS